MYNNQTVLSVKNLTKTYREVGHEVYALSSVSFDLFKGEMLAVMGTSGSGKSTLLNILGALDEPDKGDIFINGSRIDSMFTEPFATKYRAEYIGFIFQSYHLLKDLTVGENIALPLILKGVKEEEIKRRLQQMCELIGLTKWINFRPVQLSGGQQQRVAVGRALITTPPILLADEPTGNLDFNTSIGILDMLSEMKNRLNQSIVLVTHDPMVASYADRVVFFHDGQIVDSYQCKESERNIENILNRFKKIMENSI